MTRASISCILLATVLSPFVYGFNPFEFSCSPRSRQDTDWGVLRRRILAHLSGDLALQMDDFAGEKSLFEVWYGSPDFRMYNSDMQNCQLGWIAFKMSHQSFVLENGFLIDTEEQNVALPLHECSDALRPTLETLIKPWYNFLDRVPLSTILASGWPMFDITNRLAEVVVSSNSTPGDLLSELRVDTSAECLLSGWGMLQQTISGGNELPIYAAMRSSVIQTGGDADSASFRCSPVLATSYFLEAVSVLESCRTDDSSRYDTWSCALKQHELVWKGERYLRSFANIVVTHEAYFGQGRQHVQLLTNRVRLVWRALDMLQNLQRREYFISCISTSHHGISSNHGKVCPACEFASQLEWFWESVSSAIIMEWLSIHIAGHTRDVLSSTIAHSSTEFPLSLCNEGHQLHEKPACRLLTLPDGSPTDPLRLPWSRAISTPKNIATIHRMGLQQVVSKRWDVSQIGKLYEKDLHHGKEVFVTMLCDTDVQALWKSQQNAGAVTNTLKIRAESIRTLVYSVRKSSLRQRPFLVLVVAPLPHEIHEYLERACGVHVVLLPTLKDMGVNIRGSQFSINVAPAMWARLQLFALEEYKSIVYLDADQLVTAPLDGIFDLLSENRRRVIRYVAPGVFPHLNELNIGVMGIRPSKSLFDMMVHVLNNQLIFIPESIPSQDQDWLTTFFYHHYSFGGVAEFDSTHATMPSGSHGNERNRKFSVSPIVPNDMGTTFLRCSTDSMQAKTENGETENAETVNAPGEYTYLAPNGHLAQRYTPTKSDDMFCMLPLEYNFCATQICLEEAVTHKHLQEEITKSSIRGRNLGAPELSLNMRVIHWPGLGRKPWSRYHHIARSGFDELWWQFYEESCSQSEDEGTACLFACAFDEN